MASHHRAEASERVFTPHIISPPKFFNGECDSERDGLPYSTGVEAEKDCGKCLESERKSVLVLNSRDAGDPNCPRRLCPETSVKRAIKENNISEIRSYIQQNKRALAQKDAAGVTPFHYACWHGLLEIVLLLSNALFPSDLQATDSQGWSALHFACDAHVYCAKIIKHLLNKLHFDPRQETNRGSTPASLATYKGHFEGVKYLTDFMSKLGPVNPENQRLTFYEDPPPKLMVHGEYIYHSIQSDHPNGDRNMSQLENRLYTFTMGSSSWSRAHPTERQLAEQGFVYTGVEERVFCFCCKAVINFWDDGVDPLLKHYDANQRCQFLCLHFRLQLDRLLSQRSITHANPHYANNSARLHTFQTWQHSRIVSSFKLASAGFYYLGSGLQTRCFSCGLLHDYWKRGDIPLEVHRRRNPHCEFLRNLELLPVEAAAVPHMPTQVKPNYELLENRIKSFKLLPKNVPVSGEECAKAGLFFLRKPDVMQCFTCDAIVRGWISGDIPSEKHRAISSQCKFLRDHFPTKLDQYDAQPKVEHKESAYATHARPQKQKASHPIDPNSLPEPEFTQEDLERMAKKESNFSSLSLHQSDPLKPIQPSPEESGYVSNSAASYSNSASKSSDVSLSSFNTCTTPGPHQYSSHESPVRQKLAVNQKLSMPPKECVVCMDNGLEVVLLPCRHLCMCQSCAYNIDQCPMCRRPVESTVRVYLP